MDLIESKDPRVIKTNRAIYAAFIKLMDAKGLEAMTVQDILDEALVNRKTFYKYYRDKYDLAERVGRAYLQEFDGIVERRLGEDLRGRQAMEQVASIYRELYDRKDEIRVIWRIRTERLDVRAEMQKKLQRIYLQLAEDCGAQGDTAFQANMFSTLVLSSYEHIMENDEPFEAHKLIKEYHELCEVLEKSAG